MVASYTPERVAEICGVPADHLEAAAMIFSSATAVVSTVLQGVYQSNQAAAASVA